MNDELPMQERRNIGRYQLASYLTVYNRNTGRAIGSIGNISARGLMLITQLPVMVGETFHMQIKLPGSNDDSATIDFDARSHWSREDVDPTYFDTGFSLEGAQPGIVDIAATLKEFFSFKSSKD